MEKEHEIYERRVLIETMEGLNTDTLERLKSFALYSTESFAVRYLAAICYNLVCDLYRREEQQSERR